MIESGLTNDFFYMIRRLFDSYRPSGLTARNAFNSLGFLNTYLTDASIFDNPERLLNFIHENYGHAGRKFVTILLELGVSQIKELVQEFVDKVSTAVKGLNKSKKQILPVAIILTADKLATEYIFHDSYFLDMDTAIGWMEDENAVSDYQRFYTWFSDNVYSNPLYFEGLFEKGDDFTPPKLWGKYSTKEGRPQVAIRPSILEEWCKNKSVNPGQMLDWLDSHNLLIHDSGNRRTKNTYLLTTGESSRMHVILLPHEEEQPLEDASEFRYITPEEFSQEELPFS